jgi:prephenate dehydrogenase
MSDPKIVDGVDEGPVEGPVLIVGAGLIGASIGFALRRAGVEVLLEDASPTVLQEAIYRGAGKMGEPGRTPSVVVIAVPPDAASGEIARAAERFPEATITDTTSVKGLILDEAIEAGADAHRLVGGHPMAGREISGPEAARADLFDDRLWILTPTGHEGQDHVARVRRLVTTCGAQVLSMDPAEHDAAVALVSHVPQIVASSLAAALVGEPADRIQIAGTGLSDTTRIAGSDPQLWTQILRANAGPVSGVLEGVTRRLQQILDALTPDERASARHGGLIDRDQVAPVTEVLDHGRQGHARIPGKHGATSIRYAIVPVMVEDKPGELARLFVAAGDLGVNLEDVRIEHVLGRPSGLVDLFVRPDVSEILAAGLTQAGFDVRA